MATKKIIDAIVGFFFPKRCIFCQNIAVYGKPICDNCAMPEYAKDASCKEEYKKVLSGVASAFVYQNGVKKTIVNLKTYNLPAAVEFFAEHMYIVFCEKFGEVDFDLLIEVPKNPNQSYRKHYSPTMIAIEFSDISGIERASGVLSRSKNTKPQHKLNVAQRLENALSSYRVKDASGIKNKTILIIDDVLTTGATGYACGAAMLAAGAKAVYLLSAVTVENSLAL